MRAIISAAVVLFAQNAFPYEFPEGALLCNPAVPMSKLKVHANPGQEINVYAQAYVSGHRWISKEGIEEEIVEPAKVGSVYTSVFKFEAPKAFKTYRFILKRPWESTIVSKCAVTVSIK